MDDQAAALFLDDLIACIDRASQIRRRLEPITWDRAAALLVRAGAVYRGTTGPDLKRIITADLARLNIREAAIESETGPTRYGFEMAQVRLALRRVSHAESPIEITVA